MVQGVALWVQGKEKSLSKGSTPLRLGGVPVKL